MKGSYTTSTYQKTANKSGSLVRQAPLAVSFNELPYSLRNNRTNFVSAVLGS